MFEGCADDFHCTNQGQSPVIDGVDDAKEMHNTRRALSLLGEFWFVLVLCIFIVSGLSDMIDHHLLFCCSVCIVGISESYQMAIYQILAAILHLSNVEVKDQSADRSSILVNTNYPGQQQQEIFCLVYLVDFMSECCTDDV